MFSVQEVFQPTRSKTREIEIVSPEVTHGGDIWRLAKGSEELDLNSSYMYLLFARDFAETSRVVLVDDEVVAFTLAYRRAEEPECLFVWQIAVDEEHRGRGFARRMLDDLIASSLESDDPIRKVESTVTKDNTASNGLFHGLAERWGADLRTDPLFDESHFPDEHEAELLHEIGPIDPNALD